VGEGPGGGCEHRHYAEHVDLDHAPRVVERITLDGSEHSLVPRVVHEPTERAEPVDRSRDGSLVRDVEGHVLGIEPATHLLETLARIRMIGEGEPVPAFRQHLGERGSDVACGTCDEDGRHRLTVFRLTSAVSKMWTLPCSDTRTLSPGEPANGAAAFATMRRSSPSWSITRWTNASEPRSSTTRIRPGTGPPSPKTTASGRNP